ncbi:hypothetical protein DL765_001845 [Monosporascus sp. GIB2]|nr:hypothetical protein DL765_001845 [Monosporascus sp. GIB2]
MLPHALAAVGFGCAAALFASMLVFHLDRPRTASWYAFMTVTITLQFVSKYVRFGPNRISINSAAASSDLHDVNANTFKSSAYSSFKRFFGAEMSLTTVDHKAHAFRRRVNAKAMTPAAVKAFEDKVTPHVDYMIQSISRNIRANGQGWSTGQDMAHLVAYCIADIMGDVTFSQHWNVQRDGKNRRFVHDLPKGVAGIHLVGHMQWLFLLDLHLLLFPQLIQGIRQLMEVSRGFAKNRAEMSGAQDIWAYLLDSRDPKTGRKFTQEELTSEASLFIIGGTDGMITATTATLFYLLHNPPALDRLTREIRNAFPARKDCLPGMEEAECPVRFASPELQKITYLPACIDEAMRLSPPVPSILPRAVGPGGMLIEGEFFPEGIDIGIPHYSLHRSPEYFPEPLKYKPERWLQGEYSHQLEQPQGARGPMVAGSGQASSFMPFGAGRSSCIGKHMAYQEVSYILARLIWHYDMRLDPDMGHIGEGTGTGPEGRERKDEFQLYCRFVSEQDGPVIQFKVREDIKSS